MVELTRGWGLRGGVNPSPSELTFWRCPVGRLKDKCKYYRRFPLKTRKKALFPFCRGIPVKSAKTGKRALLSIFEKKSTILSVSGPRKYPLFPENGLFAPGLEFGTLPQDFENGPKNRPFCPQKWNFAPHFCPKCALLRVPETGGGEIGPFGGSQKNRF